MIVFKVKELLEKHKMTRYKFQQATNWNYKRVNAYYFGKVISINIEDLNKLCELFHCKISDIIEYKQK